MNPFYQNCVSSFKVQYIFCIYTCICNTILLNSHANRKTFGIGKGTILTRCFGGHCVDTCNIRGKKISLYPK